jgi:hypothetical protein
VLLALILAYGALLRLDAISQTFGPVTGPWWLRGLQRTRMGASILRPDSMRWEPSPVFRHRDGPASRYSSDPYTYLHYAREMHAFYAAHRREPVFPFATKIFLRLLDQQDVAVSFASATFSVIAIAATYLLGAAAFSSAAGLGAAFLMAIEYDVITNGTAGWRDDAFMCGVLLSALAMVRYVRDPAPRRAVALGLITGAACLVRITALSFVVPGFACLLLATRQPWRERLAQVGLATVVMTIVVAPFLVNCWRVFGDPFYSINVHADVYRATEGAVETSVSARDYIEGHLRTRPVRTLDTLVLGLTRYPFANKWGGFERWVPSSGRWLSWAALAGLLLFTGTAAGRLLLVVLVASLVPYAVTWQLIFDWRFTEHAYPFFLIAACVAVTSVGGTLWSVRSGVVDLWPPAGRTVAFWGAMVGAAILGWLVITRVMPGLTFEEALRAGESATILAGDRDALFFTDDWPQVVTSGAMSTRVASGTRASLRVPLPADTEYDGFVRMDPARGPMAAGTTPVPIHVLLNGRLLATCDTGSTPARVGACRFHVPAGIARKGMNRLTFAAGAPVDGFRLWYLRLQQSFPAAPPR